MNIALCSFGMSGRVFHAPFIAQHPHLNLYAVVERHRSESRELYPKSKLYRSVAEMLQDPSVDVVVVNTPVQTHYKYAKEALLAGKHVLVEKPFTVTAEEARALDTLAKEKGKLLTVYQNRRYDGDYLKVKEIVKSGVLGAHLIDQALQLFGKPIKTYADLGYLRKGTQTDDYFEVICFYDNQLRVRLKSTTFALERQWEYVLHGTKGSFLQQRFDGQEAALVAGTIPEAVSWLSEVKEPNGILHTLESRTLTTAQHGNYWQFYEDFYQALIGKKENPIPASEAIEVINIIDELANRQIN